VGSHGILGKEILEGVIVYRIEGPMFLAAAEKLGMRLHGSGGKPLRCDPFACAMYRPWTPAVM
jgi:hypothetical protein